MWTLLCPGQFVPNKVQVENHGWGPALSTVFTDTMMKLNKATSLKQSLS
jgi:hypothetical protein